MRNEMERFKLLGFVKGRLTLGLLLRGYHVLLSDADSVWLGNPWPWIGVGGVSSGSSSVGGSRRSIGGGGGSVGGGRSAGGGGSVGDSGSVGSTASAGSETALAEDAGMLPFADVLTTNDYPDLRRDGQPDSVCGCPCSLYSQCTSRPPACQPAWLPATMLRSSLLSESDSCE